MLARSPRRVLRPLAGLAALTALATALGLAAPAPGVAGPAPGVAGPATVAQAPAEKAPKKKAARQPAGTTVFQLGSFNLLGAGHTDGGPRDNYLPSSQRLTITKNVIEQRKLGVIGFQEMHKEQVALWNQRYSSGWGLYPGASLGEAAGHNSITWRKSEYELVQAKWLAMPYFKGEIYKMPYVMLRHRATGTRFWVSNVHLPANTSGPAQKWRDEGMRRQATLVAGLHRQYPKVPVFLTGDMNERERFVCTMLKIAPVRAANGGYADASTCQVPPAMSVDWIVGTPNASFTGYVALDDDQVNQASDHPFIIANVHVPTPKARALPVRKVVLIAVNGLRSDVIARDAERLRWLTLMRRRGTSTLDARTAPESTLPLPNLTSVLTGRAVTTGVDGHRVVSDADTGATVHDAAGKYVSSIFDMAHNNQLSTRLYTTQDRDQMLVRSWRDAGGRDPYWVDNGTDKFTSVQSFPGDEAVARSVVSDLTSSTPADVSVVALSGPERAGREHGFDSPEYLNAVRGVASVAGRIMHYSNAGQQTKGRTLVVLVGTSGGQGSTVGATGFHSYRVPFLAWGAGVRIGGDLYAMNPVYRRPGTARGAYGAQGPIMVGSAANLLLQALRLPALPGSRINDKQNLTVWK
ncbi:alkaline phosphatase family protein [Nocardioides sp. C4-1]|uniref:alkaline phosphatase family protein n=1 Tax=Nocardioides sp. C4-1 TaxID=3151851 RepID=UPI00326571AC